MKPGNRAAPIRPLPTGFESPLYEVNEKQRGDSRQRASLIPSPLSYKRVKRQQEETAASKMVIQKNTKYAY